MLKVYENQKNILDSLAVPAALSTRSTQRRKEIDRKYDYRSSRLTHVFGKLLQEGRLREEELSGLREDKRESIRSYAKFLSEMDAA